MGIALCSSAVAFAFLLLLVQVVLVTSARHIDEDHGEHKSSAPSGMRDGMMEKVLDFEKQMKLLHKRPDTLQVAGSSLPDCSHACGSCTPCMLVMVNFVCSSLEEAETCPMAYKCVCNSKSYPVP